MNLLAPVPLPLVIGDFLIILLILVLIAGAFVACVYTLTRWRKQ